MAGQRRLVGFSPPWLWFWALFWLIGLPASWQASIGTALTLAELQVTQNRMMRELNMQYGQLDFLLLPGYFLETTIFVVITAGLLLALLPFMRERYLVWRYGLDAPTASLTVTEDIKAFLARHGAEWDIYVNLRRSQGTAFVFPRGYRGAGLALFPGFFKLWRADREAAEAVLLHEVAHHRRGDTLVIGAGSFLEAFVKHSLWLYLVLVFAPLVVITVWDSLSGQARYHPGVFVLSQGLAMLATLAYFFAVMAVLLAAIWDAEFNADSAVLEAQGTSRPLGRGLIAPATASPLTWLMQRLSHPPVGLRRWLIGQRPGLRQVLLLLVFPLGFVMRFVLLEVFSMLNELSLGVLLGSWDWAAFGQSALEHGRIFLASLAPVWLGAGLLLLAWPLLRRRGAPAVRAYALSALPLLLVAALGVLGRSPAPQEAESLLTIQLSEEQVSAGDTVDACFNDLPGGEDNWITLVPLGAELDSVDDDWGEWAYLGENVRYGCRSYRLDTQGTYEVRVYLNDGFELAARSPALQVLP